MASQSQSENCDDGRILRYQNLLQNLPKHIPLPVCLADLEKYASLHIDKMAWDYYRSGSDEEITLRNNSNAFNRIQLRPRILRNVSCVNTRTEILPGQWISSPICIAPTAMQKLAHPDGELGTAKAASLMNACMLLSSWSTTRLEAVIKSTDSNTQSSEKGTFWLQLYIYKDRVLTEQLVQRAASAGYKAIAVTVDTPVLGRRREDLRNQFQLKDHLTLANYNAQMRLPMTEYVTSQIDPSLTIKDLLWLKSITSLPVLVKGVLRGDEAIKVSPYVDGIIVSNHGGRQLDTVPASIEVLEEVVNAVQGRIPIFLDGGIRKGTDVLKALAIGAKAVFIGRPVLWGLVYSGYRGVEYVMHMLQVEFETAMKLIGCTDLRDITRDLIRTPHEIPKL
ncbi:Hydroxyacid oxidase 1 [Coelomomyces lativittatus]|nr:Hydroxyacid oxidase 1 [Coelomomyces lativittatus]KAJ1513290.1 Hydroxyacid oxidase 1 [Coelomomyces lativittatus]KAJ1513912.1 Hydroxyacid oxidase 1 [Coelomomyces lativittatus]